MNDKILVHNKNGHISLDSWLSQNNQKKLLLISHCMDRSGAPIALMYMASFLKEKGYDVVYAARGKDNLIVELTKLNLDYIILPHELNCDDFYKALARGFDCIVVNTIVMSPAVKAISTLNKKILWWIHESDDSLYNKFFLPIYDSNVFYLAVSYMVVNALKKHAPFVSPYILPYYLPETKKAKSHNDNIISFGMIGNGLIKGLDVLQQSCKLLSVSFGNQFSMKIIIPEQEEKKAFEQQNKMFKQIKIYGEMSQDEIIDFYSNIDILVCPSRCDSLPIVVSQALQNGIPCIVSNKVGHCNYFEKNYGGFVFESEDHQALMQIMSKCIMTPDEIYSRKSQALEIYQKYLSKTMFENSIKEVLDALQILIF